MVLPRTPSFRLEGRRALVTGGSRGIGFGAAVALAEAGAAVTILGRSRNAIDRACDAAREEGLALDGRAIDVTRGRDVETFLSTAEPFDILVNCAGTARHAPFLEIAPEDYDAVLELNLKAAIFVSQGVARRLVEAGRPGSIINVSSQMGHVGGPNRTVYAASKFALEGATRAMAIELGPSGIRVNTVCPTFVETELTARTLADATLRDWILAKIKLGRLARIEDLMGPILFLASDASAMVTGSSLMVDGGWTAE